MRSRVVAFALCSTLVAAYPEYPGELPNGDNVLHFGTPWTRLGHPGNSGATSTNGALDFGKAVHSNRNAADVWGAICALDSDGDGFTNGEELCDPNCTWVKGMPDPTDCRTDVVEGNTLNGPTHPGVKDGEGNTAIDPTVIHGVMMILAWLLLAPAGIFVAATQKNADDSSFDWFTFHKVTVVTAVLISICAFIVMLVTQGFAIGNLHTGIGLAVIILSILQPINGALRPHKTPGEEKETSRKVWEFVHQWIGRVLLLLAAAALATGVTIGFSSQVGGYVVAGLFIVYAIVTVVIVFRNRQGSLPVAMKN